MYTGNTIRGLILTTIMVSGLVACSKDDDEPGELPDTTAPTVVNTTPADNAIDVSRDSSITVTFSEDMDTATLTNASFTLSDGSNASGTVTAGADNRSATFAPTMDLAYNTTYTASLSFGITDVAGNALVAYSWSFTTIPDTTSPELVSVTPLASSNGQPANSIISATFDEALDCSTVSINSFQVLEDSLPVGGYTQCIGDTISFFPLPDMPTNTTLVANLDSTITDLVGNGITPYTWDFGMAPWTRQLGSTGSEDPRSMATDGSGNVFVAGLTTGHLDGNTSAGGHDMFVTKYDNSGTKQWTRQLGTVRDEFARGVTTDDSDNVFVVGTTDGDLDGNTKVGGIDMFVTKYDNNGTKQWTRQLGTIDTEHAYCVATDDSGNVFVAGSTSGGLDGNISAGNWDLFLIKFDNNGNKQWTRQLGTTDSDQAFGVTTDSSGNVFVAGSTSGSLDGNTNTGANDLFVIKYDNDGNKQWTRQLGSASHEYTSGVATDDSGNVFVAGGTLGDLDGNVSAGGADLFVTKYDGNGNKQWTQQLGSAVDEYGKDVATDGNGNIFVAGWTLGDLDGNVSAGSADLFVVKYNNDGRKR